MATWNEEANQDMKIVSRTGGITQADVTALNMAISRWSHGTNRRARASS
jgi:hypothetical protein